MKLKRSRSTLAILTILLIVGVVYRQLPSVFFQQDEWHAFARILLKGPSHIWSGVSLIQFLLGETRPLARLFYFLLFSQAGLASFWYAIASLSLHSFNTFLVWVLIKKITKGRTIAVIAALFFGINSIGSQAVTWFGNFNGTLPATSCVLLCLIFYTEFQKSQVKLWLLVSSFCFFISLLFKEVGIFLVFFVPIFELVQRKENSLLSVALKRTWFFWGYGGLVLAGRFLGFWRVGESVGRFVGKSGGFVPIFLHLIAYPIEGLFQVLIPGDLVFPFARFLTPLWFSGITNLPNLDLISESVVSEAISLIAGTLLLVFLIILIKNWWNKEKFYYFAQQILLAGSFFYLSFLPYIILNKPDAYLESRYYYVSVIGAGWLLGIIFASWQAKFKGKIKSIVFIPLVLLLLINAGLLQRNIQKLIEISKTRKSFLQQILKDYPQLPKRVAFYFTGNPPFQSGFGQTLMVLYSQKGELKPAFFENEFLWDLGSQGYQEIEGRGFGYFDELSEVQKAIYRNRLSLEDIVVYDWNQKEEKLTNITKTAKAEMLGNQQRITRKDNWKIKPYVETENAQVMIDDDFESSWSNLTGYQPGQKIEIDLGALNELTSVVLFYPEDNQANMLGAGYKIEVSENSEMWTTVFEKTPFFHGKWVEMFFCPTLGQHIRITQLGAHAVAYWSIAEIDIYTKSIQ